MPYDATPLPRLAQDLIAARRLLIETGWSPCASFEEPYCVGMAIWRGLNVSDDRKWDALHMLRMLLGSVSAHYIFEWNDTKGRTFEDVLALLDQAIATATVA